MAAFLPYVIPMCVQRLGQQEIIESCEELRFLMMEFLTGLVKLCKEKMSVYVDDMMKILQKTIVDPFHQLKKVSLMAIKSHLLYMYIQIQHCNC